MPKNLLFTSVRNAHNSFICDPKEKRGRIRQNANADGLERMDSLKNKGRDHGEVAHAGSEVGEADTASHVRF
jgi:hypothetical protein